MYLENLLVKNLTSAEPTVVASSVTDSDYDATRSKLAVWVILEVID